MARPREFDTDAALADAMNVFWQHGYDAATLPALLKGMGLTRGSLYKAFADKKTLFLKSLNRYEAEAVDPAIALLTTGLADGLERISTLFRGVLEAVEHGDQRGCLLCSAAAGPSAVDTDISEVVQRQLRKMGEAFYIALTQSASYKETEESKQRSTASLLLTQYIGLRVMIKSKAPIGTIRESVKAINMVIS